MSLRLDRSSAMTFKIILVTTSAVWPTVGQRRRSWRAHPLRSDAREQPAATHRRRATSRPTRARKASTFDHRPRLGSQASVDQAIAAIIIEHGRIDVVVHNAERTSLRPAEAFTPEQLAELYESPCSPPSASIAPSCRRCAGAASGLLIWTLVEQQCRRHATLSVARVCRQGGVGRYRRAICA